MSVSWSVFPIVPEVTEWLTEQGLTIPNVNSRYATLDELLTVLSTFDEPVRVEPVSSGTDSIYSMVLGYLGQSKQFAQILGSIEDGKFHFFFDGSGNESKTMLTILEKLSVSCGALVIHGNTPCIVTSDIDIDSVASEWDVRKKS